MFRRPPHASQPPLGAALRALRLEAMALGRQKKRRLERRVFNDNVKALTLSSADPSHVAACPIWMNCYCSVGVEAAVVAGC